MLGRRKTLLTAAERLRPQFAALLSLRGTLLRDIFLFLIFFYRDYRLESE